MMNLKHIMLFSVFVLLWFGSALVEAKEIKEIGVQDITIVSKKRSISNTVDYVDGSVDFAVPFQLIDAQPAGIVTLKRGIGSEKGLWYATRNANMPDTDVTLEWSYKGHTTISKIYVRGEVVKFEVKNYSDNKKITRNMNYTPYVLIDYSFGPPSIPLFLQDVDNVFKVKILKGKDIAGLNSLIPQSFRRKPNAKDGLLEVEFSYNEYNTFKETVKMPVVGQIAEIEIKPENKVLTRNQTATMVYRATYTDGTENAGPMTSRHHPELVSIDPPNGLKFNKPGNSYWYLSVTPETPTGPVNMMWRVVDGETRTFTNHFIVHNEPIVARMDIGSAPAGYCSHIDLYLDVAIHFNQSMKKTVIPTIELEWAKDQWKTVEIKDPKWSDAIVSLKDSKFNCKIKIPHVDKQKIFMPRFRVTKAEGLNDSGVMEPHIHDRILPYLYLKHPTKNWIVLSKNTFKPGGKVIGRFNRALKEGTVFFAVYIKGAANKDYLGFRYAPQCSWTNWAANNKPGKYEYRLVQQIRKDDKIIYKKLASAEFEVKK